MQIQISKELRNRLSELAEKTGKTETELATQGVNEFCRRLEKEYGSISSKPDYCTKPDLENCQACSLANYNRDCQNSPL